MNESTSPLFEGNDFRCCFGDGSGPPEIGLQEQVSNRRVLLQTDVCGVERPRKKAFHKRVSGECRGDERKRTVVLRIVRYRDVVKTAEVRSSRDESEGYLFTAQTTAGVQTA